MFCASAKSMATYTHIYIYVHTSLDGLIVHVVAGSVDAIVRFKPHISPDLYKEDASTSEFTVRADSFTLTTI